MACAEVTTREMTSIEDTPVTLPSTESDFQIRAQEPPQNLESQHHLPILPREVLKQIIIHAMTAKDSSLNVHCLKLTTSKKRKINTACLLLDRDLYHVARHALFQYNTFIFNHFGSRITAIVNLVGLWTCRQEGCLHGGGPPVLNHAVLNLGCDINPERSLIRVQAFTAVLESLRRPLHVNKLELEILAYCWRCEAQLKAFCQALTNVKVYKNLIVKGLDVHLELPIRELPKAVGFDVQPIESGTRFRTADWQNLGSFRAVYVPAAKTEGVDQTIDGTMIDDPIAKYLDWLKTAKQDWIVNGLDYVTDYSMSP